MEHIREMIENGKKQVGEMEKAGIYSKNHINTVKEDIKQKVREAYKEAYQNNIYRLKDMQNDVIRKHDPNADVKDPERPEVKYRMTAEERYKNLSEDWRNLQIEMDQRRGIFEYDINGTPIVDGAVIEGETREVKTRQEVDIEASQKLLENRRMETEVKAARTADLKAELETISKTKGGNINKLNLVCAELRNRGEHDTADQIIDRIEAHNVKEPWKNDPDFMAADRKIKEQEVYINVDDMLFIDEDSDKHISIDDIFKVDEEKEKEEALREEIAKENERKNKAGK